MTFTLLTYPHVSVSAPLRSALRVNGPLVFGRPFLKRFALRYRRCLSVCLSVTLVYCDQTVGWISKVYVDLYSALS